MENVGPRRSACAPKRPADGASDAARAGRCRHLRLCRALRIGVQHNRTVSEPGHGPVRHTPLSGFSENHSRTPGSGQVRLWIHLPQPAPQRGLRRADAHAPRAPRQNMRVGTDCGRTPAARCVSPRTVTEGSLWVACCPSSRMPSGCSRLGRHSCPAVHALAEMPHIPAQGVVVAARTQRSAAAREYWIGQSVGLR